MKKFLLLLLATITMTCGFSQNRSREEVKEQVEAATGLFTEDHQDTLYALIDDFLYVALDSMENEGRYIQALELIDSTQSAYSIVGRHLSPKTYLKKTNILWVLEEWRDLIKTTEECISIHKSDSNDRITERIFGVMYRVQGSAHMNLGEYREAILSYENSSSYCTRLGELDGQADDLCSMAYCYYKLGKPRTAMSFYEKGINKYLDYFETSRTDLLRGNFSVKDSYKQVTLMSFAESLFYYALLREHVYGSKLESKNYLLMSAHCGYAKAKSEYQRLYGDR